MLGRRPRAKQSAAATLLSLLGASSRAAESLWPTALYVPTRSQHVQLGGVVVSRPSGFWPPKYHRRRIAVTLIEAESNVNVRVDQCPPPWAREGASIHSHIHIRFRLD